MKMKAVFSIIKKYWKILLSTLTISALGFAIMIALSNSYLSVKHSLNSYVKKYNYPDIEIQTSPSTVDKLANLKSIKGVEDYNAQYWADTVMLFNDMNYYTIRAITYDDTDFQKYYTWQEKEINDKDTVFLEYRFAISNNIHVGDKIKIKVNDDYREFYINKLVSLPETLAISVMGDSWTLSTDFGCVYISRELLAKKSENQNTELQDDLETDNSNNGIHNEMTKELEKSKGTLNQNQQDLKASEESLNKKASELSKSRSDLLNAQNTAAENRQKLVKAEAEVKALKTELENNKKQLIEIQDALDRINGSISTIKANRAVLNDKETVAFMKLMRRLPGKMTIAELKAVVNYADSMLDAYEEVNIPVNIENTPLSQIGVLDYYADQVINQYDLMGSLAVRSLVELLKNENVLGLNPEYFQYFDLINSYVHIVDYDNIQDAYNAAYQKLGKIAGYIRTYKELNVSQYFTEDGINVPLKELIGGFSHYESVANKMKSFFNISDSTTIKELLNKYDGAVAQSETTLNNLESERSSLITQLHRNGINENEIGKGIKALNNQISECDKELTNIKNAIASIDNKSGDLNANLKQVTDGLSKLQKDINNNKNALSDASKTTTDGLSDWMDSSKQIKDTKDQIEQAIDEDGNQYNYEDYFNRIVIKIADGANVNKTMKLIEDELKLSGVEISRITPYKDSLVQKRIDNNIIPIKKISDFLPTVFFIILAIITFLFLNLIVKQCRREQDILKTVDYNKKTLKSIFAAIIFIISIGSVIFGALMGHVLTKYVVVYYKNLFPLPFVQYKYNIRMYIILSIITLLVGQIAVLFGTSSLNNINSSKDMSNDMGNDIDPKALNKWNAGPMTKYSVIALLSNFKRFVFGCLCISATVMMIFVSLSIINADQNFYDELFNRRINYDAEIYMYDNVDDDFVSQIESLGFVTDVELLSYYNADIEFNNKTVKSTINLIDKNSNMVRIEDQKKNPIKLQEKGIVLNYITAKQLGVEAGDKVKIGDSYFKVTDLAFQNVKMTEYLSLDELDKFNTKDIKVVLVKLKTGSEQKMLEFLQSKDDYLYTSFTSVAKQTLLDGYKTLNLVASLIIVFAIVTGLIIIVNTNLTNLFEQKRKLCILKSLGYPDGVISKHWFIQSIMELIVAVIIGFPFGIIVTVKTLQHISDFHQNYLFINSFKNYAITTVLVLMYLIISHLICTRKIKKWDIAEEVKVDE